MSGRGPRAQEYLVHADAKLLGVYAASSAAALLEQLSDLGPTRVTVGAVDRSRPGQHLEAARSHAGMSQAAIARAVWPAMRHGGAKSKVQNLMRGIYSAAALSAVAAYLSIEVGQLYQEPGQ